MNEDQRSEGRVGRLGWMILFTTTLPMPAFAQANVVLDGRVIEAGEARGVENAAVELEGHSIVLTSADGTFRIEGVEPGAYAFRVEALGYSPASRVLVIDEDITVTVPLQPAPLVIDSLVVETRAIDIEGRLRDPVRDIPLTGADVVSDQVATVSTNARGRFELEVWEGIPLVVGIRAFGYLPLDTLILPAEDDTYLIELARDPLIERMIEEQIARLDDRAGGRLSVSMRPINREGLLRWSGATLLDVLQSKYPRLGRRIRCVVVDERVLSGLTVRAVLQTTLVEDVERIEFLFRGAMLRVYTREFIRNMLAGGLTLRRPTYSEMSRPPFCL